MSGGITSHKGQASWRGRGGGAGRKGKRSPGQRQAASPAPRVCTRGSGRRWHGPFSFNRPCAWEIEATSISQHPSQEPQCGPALQSCDGACTPLRMHKKKRLKFILICSCKYINSIFSTSAGLWRSPVLTQEKSLLCDKLERQRTQNGHSRAPHLSVSCPRVAKRSWHPLIDKYR